MPSLGVNCWHNVCTGLLHSLQFGAAGVDSSGVGPRSEGQMCIPNPCGISAGMRPASSSSICVGFVRMVDSYYMADDGASVSAGPASEATGHAHLRQ